MHLHNNEIIKKIIERLNFLDPLHPHQFTLNSLINLLNKYGLRCIFMERVDELRIILDKEVAHLADINRTKSNFFENLKIVDLFRRIIRKAFFLVLEIIGYSRHSKTLRGKSVWVEYLLVFKKF